MKKFASFFVGSLLYWVGATLLLYLLRFVGIADEGGVQVQRTFYEYESNFLLLVIFIGVLSGFCYVLTEVLLYQPFFKRRSFGFALLSKVLMYMFTLSCIGGFIELVQIYFLPFELLSNSEEPFVWRTSFWVYATYFVIVSFIFSFVRMVAQKFGRGVLLDMLLGKYRKPKEEKRIFMFLDLRSSTFFAEKLGHIKYSQLIQQCFYDLNEVAALHEAEIYQYVGDEAVLSWPYRHGIDKNRCLMFFFEFQNFIRNRESFYKERFGLTPEFKAGLHGGEVMVAEIGVVKKDIAYHGDVVNTTARIQGECNKYGENLLVSETLLRDLTVESCPLTQRPLGEITLRGKEKLVTLIALRRKTTGEQRNTSSFAASSPV